MDISQPYFFLSSTEDPQQSMRFLASLNIQWILQWLHNGHTSEVSSHAAKHGCVHTKSFLLSPLLTL